MALTGRGGFTYHSITFHLDDDRINLVHGRIRKMPTEHSDRSVARHVVLLRDSATAG